jgi:hypothetical protein
VLPLGVVLGALAVAVFVSAAFQLTDGANATPRCR